MRKIAGLTAIAAASMLVAAGADADVTISSAPTQDMSCSSGICAPTASDAVLNVSDLENLLASSNVTVTTTGSGVQAANIEVKGEFGWSSANTLFLDAFQSITVDRVVSIAGTGGLVLGTDDGGRGGALTFVRKGHAVFHNLASQLTINGILYTLENSLPSLANAIARNPAGNYALANNYDASADGTYTVAPIATLSGHFDGVGNEISNLSISPTGASGIGLFATIATGARVADVSLGVAIDGSADGVGALADVNEGTIEDSFASGTIECAASIGGLVRANNGSMVNSGASVSVEDTSTGVSIVGGLVAYNGKSGAIEDSFATGAVSVPTGLAGGLVGQNGSKGEKKAMITRSYATGAVSAGRYYVGGLVGANHARIVDSYSTGTATGADSASVGGLAGFGQHDARLTSSYSTGLVSGGKPDGGFVGTAKAYSYFENAYWDTDTSGITNLSQGAGNIANFPGITGLTTRQLQSGLPAGFDPKIWAENSSINGGLPYLITNQPHRSIR